MCAKPHRFGATGETAIRVAIAFRGKARDAVGVTRVIVIGDIDAFRRIVASALRASGIEAIEAAIGAQTVRWLAGEHADVVIVHPPQGVFAGAYLEQINRVSSGARVFVVQESSTVTAIDDGSVSYVSRVQVRELVETVCRLAASAAPTA
jgi:DNA-binding NtrC family response regulator